ncbi:hypothetical protein KJ059_16270 [Myxococcota bacterium]|nr:hypothetical protein [Myxococcota bacterium]MCZ7619876.1 hypothetical protein [Myxococcota bacterium]
MTERGTSVRGGPPVDRADADPNVQHIPWVFEGILAGVIGAATVAVLFLVFDLLEGRPLWTPFALGAGLFRGEIPPRGTPIEPVLITAYTVLHGGVFTAVGLLAASELMTGSRLPGAGSRSRALVLATLLLVAFSAIFAGFAALGVPGVMQLFGIGRIALANLLASGAMAVTLTYRSEHARIGG